MALEDDLNNYDWGSWDQQAADYLNSDAYFPTYDLGNLDIPNVDLTGGGNNIFDLGSLDLGGYTDLFQAPSYNFSTGNLDQLATLNSLFDISPDTWASPDYNQIGSYYVGGDLSPYESTALPYQDTWADLANYYSQSTGLPIDQYAKMINGQDYVIDEATGNIVGYRNENGEVYYYQDLINAANNGVSNSTFGNQLGGQLASKPDYLQKILEEVGIKPKTETKPDPTPTPKPNPKIIGALKAAQALAQGIGLTEKPKAPAARGTAGSASWGPTQQRSARSFYAKGGEVKPNAGGLGGITIAIVDAGRKKGLIPGEESGQEDNVEAMLSPGEYVFDAETVSALGDGNTAAGAKRLDEMRKSVRKHKRGGALSEIAPKAKKAQEYLKG